MRKTELVRRVGERLQDGARRHLPPRDRIVQPGHVARPRFPCLHSAGVHDLHRVPARGAEHPGGVVAGSRQLTLLDLAQQVLVVAHQDEDPSVHAGRVVELGVTVPRQQRCHGGVERRRVAESCVPIPRREGARHGAARARPGLAFEQDRSRSRIGRVLVGNEPAGMIAARAREMSVDVHPAGHHDHAARIESGDARREATRRYARPRCRRPAPRRRSRWLDRARHLPRS